MKSKTFIPLLVFALGSITLTSKADTVNKLIGFQNIPWGTHIDKISKNKLGLTEVNLCDGKESLISLAKEQDFSCRMLENENYRIGSTKFKLSFNFNHKGLLKYLTITYFNRAKNVQDNEMVINNCDLVFEETKRLLALKYGEGYALTEVKPQLLFRTSNYHMWIPMPTEIWIAKSTGRPEIFQDNNEVCEVKIQYTKRISPETEKL